MPDIILYCYNVVSRKDSQVTENPPIRFLPVFDTSGYPTSQCLSETEVHARNLLHACVNVCVTDEDGNIYQQRRGHTTKIFPGKVDMFLASDHIIDEDVLPAMAVERALKWRVGITLPDADEVLPALRPVLMTPSQYWVKDPSFPAQHGNHGYFHYALEYVYVILVKGLGTEIPLRLQKDRVLGVRRRPLWRMIEDFQSSHLSEEYRGYAHRTPNEAAMLQAIYTEVQRLTGR